MTSGPLYRWTRPQYERLIAYGSAWGRSSREASAKALNECRPHGGASCKIYRQVCSGAGR
jgi:uncharacterized protein DUF4189